MSLILLPSIYSDTLSQVFEINNGTNTFSSTPFSSYNVQEDNFLLTWNASDQTSNYIYASIYNSQGSVVVPTKKIFSENFNPQNAITSCYNSKNNQYLITWYDYALGITFALLDSEAILIKGPLNLQDTRTSGNINCCFNPFTQQYFLSWAATPSFNDYPPYFAIINSDGTVFKGATLINCVNSQAANGGNINCCFNTKTQQYLMAWTSTPSNKPFFSIINADGSIFKNDIAIEGESYKSIATCYNSREDTYFLTWFQTGGAVYYCTLDKNGIIIENPKLLPDLLFDDTSDLYCTYNPLNNNFLISGPSTPAPLKSQFCVISSQGEYVYPPTILENPNNKNSPGMTFSSFGSKKDTFIMTRTTEGFAKSYFQLFTQTPPPTSKSAMNKKTCFPSFTPTNPGKTLF